MDIRIVEGRRIVNVSEKNLEVQGKYVVGITREGKQVMISECKGEEEAERVMEKIIEAIVGAHLMKQRDLLIMADGIKREIEKEKEEAKEKEEKYDMPY